MLHGEEGGSLDVGSLVSLRELIIHLEPLPDLVPVLMGALALLLGELGQPPLAAVTQEELPHVDRYNVYLHGLGHLSLIHI